MISEDVIELGSSDEETEPARKRSKPMPDAMVCIPRKFHDVTITQARPNPISIAEGLGKAITVKKVVKPNVTKTKLKPVQQSRVRFGVNPMSVQSKPLVVQNKLSICKPSTIIQKPIQIRHAGPLNLPSGITVKKTVSSRPIVMLNVKKQQKANQRSVDEVLTVELDDDEAPAQKASPQWYLRPEDETKSSALKEENSSALEEANNKEPETSKLIEITIEDSPVKPVRTKQTHTVGAELAITIDDSPIKGVLNKNKAASESDNEPDRTEKSPSSKKQLIYPNETENKVTVEIEIDPQEMSVDNGIDLKDEVVPSIVNLSDEDKQINDNSQEESPNTSTDKKCESLPIKDESIKQTKSSDLSEFHPVYRSFINLCFHLENSDDMKTIVEKKIKGYYKQVPQEYTESEEFIDMVSSKMLSMKAGPEKMYLYIKDVVDELNLQRKLAKAKPVVNEIKNEEPSQFEGEGKAYDSKRQRQIRKLEKTIKKLHRAIQKLEEQEVDFDDEDDSVYLLTERYKERMVRVYAKFCQLSNTKMPSEPRIQIDCRPGEPSGPAKRLEKWINKKVPIGTPLPFPDFHDVLRCVREANEEDRLNFNEGEIMEEARDLFTRCGKKLQRRRQENEWRLAASRIVPEIDPAENNEDLKRKLNENRKLATQKETEIFNKFAERQNQLKLEAEEIGDKEAEESPVESEDEEVNDDKISLENTEKRKERLKRLLQEKSKKSSEEKDSQPHEDSQPGKDSHPEKDSQPEKDSHLEKDSQPEKDSHPEKDSQSEKDSHPEKDNQPEKDSRIEKDCQPEKDSQPSKEDLDSENTKNTETALAEDTDTMTGTVDEKLEHDEECLKKDLEEPSNEETSVLNPTETLTLSDDSEELESDIDELHLLQKLHSGNEGQSSSVDSSNSDSPIAISDSLESSDDNNMRANDDVISIENSSYSENDDHKAEDLQPSQADNPGTIQCIPEDSPNSQDPIVAEPAVANVVDENFMEIDSNSPEREQITAKVFTQTNNDEYNEAVENILLASSEDSNCDSQEETTNTACVNLRDDLISIDETIIGNVNCRTVIDTLQTTSSNVTESENIVLGVNIDSDIKYVEVTENTSEPQSQTRSEAIQNNEHIIIDELSQESVENMDIDQDVSVVAESENFVTLEENSGISNSSES